MITVDDILAEFKEVKTKIEDFKVSEREKHLILSYRQHLEMQPAINKMLDINTDEGKTEPEYQTT